MKQNARLTPGTKYRTHTKETVEFVRELDGIVEHHNSEGRLVPMHSDLFRRWLSAKVRQA